MVKDLVKAIAPKPPKIQNYVAPKPPTPPPAPVAPDKAPKPEQPAPVKEVAAPMPDLEAQERAARYAEAKRRGSGRSSTLLADDNGNL